MCSSEGVRTDPEEQASDCSSSFGYTDSSEAAAAGAGAGAAVAAGACYTSSEVQSAARDGNGALPEDRRKKALNMDWKNYRRGIEWRCRWLDLRLMELQRQATKYDEVLTEIQKTKAWETRKAPDGAARTSPIPEEQPARALLHRQRRRKVEEAVDVADYMSKHPLFQRYERKKREIEGNQQDVQPNDLAEDSRIKTEQTDADEDEDSIENILLKVESLQVRVIRLRNQLRGSMSHKLPGQLARGAARVQTPKATARPTRTSSGALPASPAAAKGSQIVRRRASDYDINNIVMPVSVGAKYVEHVKHANIETPLWRLVEKVDTPEPSSNSGDEDTDDEIYQARHKPLEERERYNRYVPRSNKKTSDGDMASKSSRGGGKTNSSHSQQQLPQCSMSAQFSEG